MSVTPTSLRGVIHGKTIVLEEESGLQDGQEVTVLVRPVAHPKSDEASPASPDELGWPPRYFELAGSIDDETFVRAPQGELPRPTELE